MDHLNLITAPLPLAAIHATTKCVQLSSELSAIHATTKCVQFFIRIERNLFVAHKKTEIGSFSHHLQMRGGRWYM
jgi:hypothetical protein